jgi:hypothetical protein
LPCERFRFLILDPDQKFTDRFDRAFRGLATKRAKLDVVESFVGGPRDAAQG